MAHPGSLASRRWPRDSEPFQPLTPPWLCVASSGGSGKEERVWETRSAFSCLSCSHFMAPLRHKGPGKETFAGCLGRGSRLGEHRINNCGRRWWGAGKECAMGLPGEGSLGRKSPRGSEVKGRMLPERKRFHVEVLPTPEPDTLCLLCLRTVTSQKTVTASMRLE